MPEQGYYGTETNPYANLYSERKIITPQTSGGSLEEGEYRLRTDLNSGDKIATYEINVGNGVEEAPVFPVSMSADSEIQKVRQVYVPGEGWGFVPVLENGAAYPQIQLYHANDGAWYKWHDSLSAIPDSAVAHFDATTKTTTGSITTIDDQVGTFDLSGNCEVVADALNGNAIYRFDGVGDVMENSDISVGVEHVILLVARERSGSPDGSGAFYDSNSAGGRRYQGWASPEWQLFNGGDTVEGGTLDTGWHLFVNFARSGTDELEVDGSTVISADAGDDTMDGLTLGARSDNTVFSEVDVGEMVHLSAPSTADVDAERERLHDKWGFSFL